LRLFVMNEIKNDKIARASKKEHLAPTALTLRFCNSCVLVLHSLHQPRRLSCLFTQLPVRVLVVLPPLLLAFLKLDVTQLQL
jgi:hypothetical protein